MNSNRPYQILYKLAQGLHESGGDTVSTTGELLTMGFSASTRPELEYTFPTWGVFTDMQQIQDWLQKLPHLKEGEAVGIWQDPEGLIYLDVVHIYTTRAVAIRVAVRHNQRSIYHLERGELIWI